MTVARTEVAGGSHPPRAVPFPRLLLRGIDFRDQLEIVTGDPNDRVSQLSVPHPRGNRLGLCPRIIFAAFSGLRIGILG
jgi:hypothetical protein